MRPAPPGTDEHLHGRRREFVDPGDDADVPDFDAAPGRRSAAVALAPVAIGYFGREASRVAVYVGAADLHGDPVAVVDGLLNPPTLRVPVRRSWSAARPTSRPRAEGRGGTLTALLDVERDARGEPVFTLYTKDPTTAAPRSSPARRRPRSRSPTAWPARPRSGSGQPVRATRGHGPLADPSKPAASSRGGRPGNRRRGGDHGPGDVPAAGALVVRDLDRAGRGRGEEQPDDGDHPGDGVAVPAPGRQGPRRERGGLPAVRCRSSPRSSPCSPRVRSPPSCSVTRPA